MTRTEFLGRNGPRALCLYLALWALSTGYIAFRGGDWAFPIASLLIFGLLLGGIIWFLTRKMDAPAVPVAQPARESFAFLAYLVVYAVILIAFGLGAVKAAIAPGQAQDLAVLAFKLIVHVLVPAGLVLLFGSALRPLLESGTDRRGFWTTLVVLSLLLFGLLAFVSPSLKQIGAFGLAPAAAIAWVLASWAWMSVEAGLCEEFLFRACLQSRLTAWLQSPATAIVVTSILFALSHWPGLYLRGGPGVDGWSTDPVQVAAFTIATLSPLSLALGLLWARSRSLLLIVLVHGAIDALPNTADLIRVWG
jgi:membrane protease YdiL (CAAX protease family)